MISRNLRRLLTLSSAAALVLAAPVGVIAAPPDQGPPGPPPHAASHAGKADSDGDKVADDLEAELAEKQPGERVDVLVQGTEPWRLREAVPSLHVDYSFRLIEGFSGSLTAGQVTALAANPWVTRVELDGPVQALDAAGDADYGVDAARAGYTGGDGTLDGDGVGLCVVDTGIDPAHEQLSGRVIGWRDWVNGRVEPYDDHGHGTHVASIAAGDGTGSAAAGRYGGVARGASLVGAKVLSSAGSGSDSDVAAAIEWCAQRDDVHVISMSLGSPGGDGSDLGSQVANAAVAAGTVVVVAAGNSGDAPGTISSPGVATDVVTVGAASDPSTVAGGLDTDHGLYLAGFSGRGPTTNPDAPLKPDLVGPGMSVVAARAGTTGDYVAYSGTSMATPFVAGVVALGLEAAPGSSPAAVKTALQQTAQDAGADGADNEWGHGLVDAGAFVSALLGSGVAGAHWPAHQLVEGEVASGATTDYPFEVATAGEPLGVTLRTANGEATCAMLVGDACWWGHEWSPDLDAYLVNPAGNVVAVSRCMLEASNGNCAAPGRFETLGRASAAAGTWTLRVESFSGDGQFVADVFGALAGGGSEPPPEEPGLDPDPEPAVPSAPADLSATVESKTQVRLAWTDTSADERGFHVQRCSGKPSCSDFATVASVTAGSSGYTDTGLRGNTHYRYRVLAWSDAGVSEPSNVASVKTPRK